MGGFSKSLGNYCVCCHDSQEFHTFIFLNCPFSLLVRQRMECDNCLPIHSSIPHCIKELLEDLSGGFWREIINFATVGSYKFHEVLDLYAPLIKPCPLYSNTQVKNSVYLRYTCIVNQPSDQICLTCVSWIIKLPVSGLPLK